MIILLKIVFQFFNFIIFISSFFNEEFELVFDEKKNEDLDMVLYNHIK